MDYNTVEISLNTNQYKWYKQKGYDLPATKVQLWCRNKKGQRTKNGVEYRIAKNTRIVVRREDLPPMSNKQLLFKCSTCGKSYTTSWVAFNKKKSLDCKACTLAKVKTTGCHTYWVNKLITNNDNARCDISEEKDKRFLVLHHLLSKKLGGKNEESNYIILSANYHQAFHIWNGGTNISCTPEKYHKFKELERQ